MARTNLGTLKPLPPSASVEPSSALASPFSETAFYFVRIHADKRNVFFRQGSGGEQRLNELGQIAADEWVQQFRSSSGVELDAWVLLSDRLEGILKFEKPPEQGLLPRAGKPRLLSSLVTGYKAAAATRINLVRSHPGGVVWRRGYQERLVSEPVTLDRLRQRLLRPGL